jgi:hypothetical protein
LNVFDETVAVTLIFPTVPPPFQTENDLLWRAAKYKRATTLHGYMTPLCRLLLILMLLDVKQEILKRAGGILLCYSSA